MTKELEGKVCVVTGASRGIGAAICKLFVEHGATVVNLDRDPPTEESDAAAFLPMDVASEPQVTAAAERIVADFGRVDVLVNNAGISRQGPSLSVTLKDWQDSMDVLATGVFLCSREFGKVMQRQGRGGIVNISSISGLTAFPMRLAYSAGKGAVVSMTKVLAVEWAGFGIRVNAVAPGMTRTLMLQGSIDEGLTDVDAYLKQMPMRRFGEPREIAEAVLFLASERSSYITGQVIVPDGGWTAFNWIRWSGDPENPGIDSRK